MFFPINSVARPVESVHLGDLTDAERTGLTVAVEGGIDIPFDRELTPDEVEAITVRLTSADSDIEQFRHAAAAYLDAPEPSDAATSEQVKALLRLALKLLDNPVINQT